MLQAAALLRWELAQDLKVKIAPYSFSIHEVAAASVLSFQFPDAGTHSLSHFHFHSYSRNVQWQLACCMLHVAPRVLLYLHTTQQRWWLLVAGGSGGGRQMVQIVFGCG